MSAVTEYRRLPVNGVELHVADVGAGPALMLLHGWPHTWQVWEKTIPRLAAQHRVLAVDLRGLGASSRAVGPFDAATIAADLLGVLDAIRAPIASVMALDASVPAAFLLAMRHPGRIRRLALMESLLPPLSGAERFLAAGPPWWFGFHGAAGLAETVLVGHEGEYLDWFLRTGTFDGRGIDEHIRNAFVTAYEGRDSLRCGFEYYRAGPTNARLVGEAVADARLTVPTLVLGGNSVGDALSRQLGHVADDLTSHLIPECGHIIPLDQPNALVDLVLPFLD